jgi:hypothetical protein
MQAARWALLAGLATLLALGGCTTAYQPEGTTGGYKDQKLADDTYRVSFFGNGYTPRPVVLKYFLYRCAELTLEHGYAYFKVYSTTRVSLRGPVRQSPFVRASYTAPTMIYIPATRITTYSATGVIRMYHRDIMIVGPDLFDAHDVVAKLGPEVRSGRLSAGIPARYRRIEGKFPTMPANAADTQPGPPPAETGPVRLEDLNGLMRQ